MPFFGQGPDFGLALLPAKEKSEKVVADDPLLSVLGNLEGKEPDSF